MKFDKLKSGTPVSNTTKSDLDLFTLVKTLWSFENGVKAKETRNNNANSVFILINRLISQGFQSGLIGPGGPGGPGVPGGQGG